MADSVRAIGKDFEFRREEFNKESLSDVDVGLARLYELFGVDPVAKRGVHDGTSPIAVTTSAAWQQQYNELWDCLVPSQGEAKITQGEAIRIVGRVSHEILDNGGINWDADFRKMLATLVTYLESGVPLAPEQLTEAAHLSARLGANSDEKAVDRLVELTVRWVMQNPNPMTFDRPDYKR